MLMTWNESLKEFYIWADSQEAYLPREIGFKRIKKVWTTKNISIAKEFTFYARDKALLTCLRSHKPQSNYAQPYPVKSSENMLKNGLAYLGFQVEGIEAALSKRNFLIADQQGTGKTIQTCGYITSLPVEKRFLIICPASMRLTWKKEIGKWTDHESHIIRKGFVSQNHKVQIINFDILKKNLDKLISRGFDVIVVDEFHLAKNPLAQRTDCVIQLTKQSERNLFLSGTPFPNSLKESFHLFNMISDEYFNSFYFHERNLKAHSNDFMIRRTRKEVLKDLPEKIRKFIYIPQDKKLSKYCFDELQAYSKKHGWVESIKFEDFSRAKREAAKLKYPLMLDSAEEMWFNCNEEQGKMVIFVYHLDIANQLQEHFDKKRLSTAVYNGETSESVKNAIVEDFQAGKIDILIASIRSAGVGLTLTRATHVLFCELDYRPDIIEQAEDRCIMEGQKVLTANGWLEIEKINIGDYVISHDGKEHKVIDAWNKRCDRSVTEIDVMGWYEPIKTTFDHLILTSDGEWKKASDFLPGDCIAMPKSNFDYKEKILFDQDCRTDNYAINNFGASQIKGTKVIAPEYISLDEETLFVFGYFAGDGYASIKEGKGKFISFSGNTTTKWDSLTRIKNWLSLHGIHYHETIRGKAVEIRGYSVEWALFFRKHFGENCYSKKLPAFCCELNKEQSNMVLKGLMRSDGYFRRNRYEYTTVSEKLASNVSRVMINADCKVCVRTGTTNHGVTSYNVAYTTGVNINDGLKVKKVTTYTRPKNKRIYDITVEDTNTFVAGLGVVHNCYRYGSEKNVLIWYLIVENSFDEHMVDAIQKKQKDVNKLMEQTTL